MYGVKGMMRHEPLTIAGLARAAGVNVETIRFYQRKGLLAEPARPAGGIRHYGAADVARARFVKAAQRIGFTLQEIAQLLHLDDGAHCAEARDIAEHKLHDVRRRIADLQRIEAALVGLVKRCAVTRGKVRCPLIASLQEAS
jgi:MerR family mercuric resistance operon transcriptional regulator